MEQNIEALVQTVVDGTATEDTVGMVLKSMKNQLSVNLIRSLNNTFTSVNALNTTVNDAIAKFIERYGESSEILDMQTLLEYISNIQDKQYRLMDLLRKVVQGKELFAGDTISDDEKKVLRLFKSFTSPEEKRRFLELVTTELAKIDSKVSQ